MTIVERILAAHSGIDIVRPGCFVMVNPDLVFANEQTGEPAIGEFKKLGKPRGFDPAKWLSPQTTWGNAGGSELPRQVMSWRLT